MIDTNSNALPVAASEDAWKKMSDQDRARLIAAWQNFWFRPGNTPAVYGVSGMTFATIVVEPAATDENSVADWKGPAPSAAERKSMEKWK